MKLNKKLNKGFTIVELVIVIAIVAILAAVLIPMFINVTKKAKESVDTQLVTNLNTVLSISEATDGSNATMHEALADAYEGGYTLEKLTPTSAGEIVWNQNTDRFELIPEGTTGTANLWKISDTYNATEGYSVYLKDGYSGTSIDATTGVDVGNNADININYTGSESVLIRTNGGNLTVDNENATVSHYGEVYKVDITAVALDSYHEYGVVNGKITVNQGHFVVESGANIANKISVSATSEVKITAKETVTLIIENTTTANVSIESLKSIFLDNNAENSVEVSTSGNIFNTVSIGSTGDFVSTKELSSSIYGYADDAAYLLSSGYYKLTEDITVEHQIFVEENNTVVLDLNGHSIESSFVGPSIVNYGTLTVNDSSESETSKGTGCVYNTSNSLSNGEYAHDGIRNFATLILNGGTWGDSDIDETNTNGTTYGAAVRNQAGGTCIINGGYFTCVDNKGTWDNGADAYSYAIRNYGEIIINYAVVYGKMNGGIAADGGEITINNGNFSVSGTNTYYILATDQGTITINGGTFVRYDYAGMLLGGFNGMPSWDASQSPEANGYFINGGIFKIDQTGEILEF